MKCECDAMRIDYPTTREEIWFTGAVCCLCDCIVMYLVDKQQQCSIIVYFLLAFCSGEKALLRLLVFRGGKKNFAWSLGYKNYKQYSDTRWFKGSGPCFNFRIFG